MRVIFASLLAWALLAAQISPAAADCCPSDDGVCDDGTQATPCCGYKPCNIFCCNCDCRSGLSSPKFDFEIFHADRGNEQLQCRSQFGAADANKDGVMSFAEWVVHSMDKSEIQPLADRWLKFDTEHKGFLTEAEAFERTAA